MSYGDDASEAMEAPRSTSPKYVRPTVQQQINEQVGTMEERLKKLRALQANLDAHPEVAEILNAATELGLR